MHFGGEMYDTIFPLNRKIRGSRPGILGFFHKIQSGAIVVIAISAAATRVSHATL
jgi:hypothetical protein